MSVSFDYSTRLKPWDSRIKRRLPAQPVLRRLPDRKSALPDVYSWLRSGPDHGPSDSHHMSIADPRVAAPYSSGHRHNRAWSLGRSDPPSSAQRLAWLPHGQGS